MTTKKRGVLALLLVFFLPRGASHIHSPNPTHYAHHTGSHKQ